MDSIFFQAARYAGVASVIIGPAALYFFISKFGGFKFNKHTISSCGESRYGIYYDIFMVIFGLLEMMFGLAIMEHYSLLDNMLVLYALIVPSVATVMAGVVSLEVSRKMHEFFGYACFILLIPWGILLHYHIFLVDFPIGLIGLVISFFMLTGTVYLYYKYKGCSIPELYFIALAMIWNIFFSFVMLL